MSEVARLRQQIESELAALRRGLADMATGQARHAFIHARMNRVGVCQEDLAHYVGEQDALMTVCQLYEQAMEQDEVYHVLP
jgi:hypothetical protein